MIKYFREINCKSFYLSYIGMICIYMIILRLKVFPQIVAYMMYAISILLFVHTLLKNGFIRRQNLLDVKVILCFFVYYVISSVIYLAQGGGKDSIWIFKDYLYSLLPILIYILIRTSKFVIDKQLFLKITLASIITIDIISLIQFLAPSSSISRLFNQAMMEGELEYVLSGLLGVIQLGFINVIGLTICLLSPIKQKIYTKYTLGLLFIICALLTGQRTPIGGITIVLFFYSLHYKAKGILGICILLVLFYYLFNNVNIEVGNFSVNEMLSERTYYKLMNIISGYTGREGQQLVFIDSVFSLLFGNGVGCYSPFNVESKVVMPDAMLYRIFNEMGLLGLTLFTFFFVKNFFDALRSNNVFMVALITYIFFANYFNRVLFVAPISIIPYALMALYIKGNKYPKIAC